MVKSLIKLFADDTKVYSRTDDLDSCNTLQKDVDALVDWSRTWQLPFNPDKFKVLRVQCRQEAFQYRMNSDANTSVPLEQCNIEKDPGVHVDNQLNFSIHIREAINKSNRLLGTIRRAYQFLDAETMMFLYKGLVRPALEYGVDVWAPHPQKDIEVLEAVQRRVTRIIPELRHLPYENRLRRRGLPTLVYRRHRGDMIHTYKYLHGLHKTRTYMLPVCRQPATRGHSLRLRKDFCRLRSRQAFYSQRVVDLWKSLPDSTVTAPTLNSFKNRLDRVWSHAPFRYDYKSLPVTTRMRTTIVFDQHDQERLIGISWRTEEDMYMYMYETTSIPRNQQPLSPRNILYFDTFNTKITVSARIPCLTTLPWKCVYMSDMCERTS